MGSDASNRTKSYPERHPDEPSHTRQRMQEDRKQRLVEATIAVIYEFGFANATVSKIASLAGTSAGNIHHYFGGKDGLLEESMRMQMLKVREEASSRLDKAKTPKDRLTAIIQSNLDPSVFSPQVCIAWLHFMANATHAPRLKRLATINAARLHSNLVSPLKELVAPNEAVAIAEAVSALIDGLWMHRALGTEQADASGLIWAFLDARLP